MYSRTTNPENQKHFSTDSINLLEKTGVLRDSFGRRTLVDCMDCLHCDKIGDDCIYCAKKNTIKPIKGCNDFIMR